MSTLGLTVRCLASTRFNEQIWEEQVKKENTADDKHGISEHVTEENEELEAQDGVGGPKAECVAASSCDSASTSDSDSDSDVYSDGSSSRESGKRAKTLLTSCVQEAQLSPDGTCIFTSDYNRSFSVYPIASTILTESTPVPLQPYSQFTTSNPIWAFAANPCFDLNDCTTTHVLVSRRDCYITLHNALWDISQPSKPTTSNSQNDPINIAQPVASYKLVNHLTEAITAPISLTYSHTGSHFFAGTRNSIATFDTTHTSDPIHTIPTIPSARSKLKGGGRGFKGWISALSLSPPTTYSTGGMLAAGSRTRYVGIYDSTHGEEITHFSLPGTVDGKKLRNENLRHIMGDGVASLKWSPCARYLYVAERQSDCLLIYDVRNFALTLGYCVGRKAMTKQKLGFDVWNAGASVYDVEGVSHEIWAGGTDGCVRVWRDPYVKEGAVEADEVVKVGEGDAPVVGTMVHASGSLAVAACGRIDVEGDEGGTRGVVRGGGVRPKYRDWGSLDILGLS